MPSKALLRPAEALAEARRVPGTAQAITGELNVQAVLARRDEPIGGLDDSGQVPWLESRGVTLICGHGRLEGERPALTAHCVQIRMDASRRSRSPDATPSSRH
jgi:pyruvate/2-oxoglutarate dehydrogenase complex dihydrolipoamide dehydrogenase (E3) component